MHACMRMGYSVALGELHRLIYWYQVPSYLLPKNILGWHFLDRLSSTPLPWSTCAFSIYMYLPMTTVANTPSQVRHSSAHNSDKSALLQKRDMMLHCQKQTVVLMLETIFIHICSTLSQVTETCLAPPREPVINYGEQTKVSRGQAQPETQLPLGLGLATQE